MSYNPVHGIPCAPMLTQLSVYGITCLWLQVHMLIAADSPEMATLYLAGLGLPVKDGHVSIRVKAPASE